MLLKNKFSPNFYFYIPLTPFKGGILKINLAIPYKVFSPVLEICFQNFKLFN